MYAILALLLAIHVPPTNLLAYLVYLVNIFEVLLVWVHARLGRHSLTTRIARSAKGTV